MRLYEFANDQMVLSTLLGVLEYLNSKRDKQPVVNTDSLVSMVKNSGVPFSYEILMDLFDQNESVQSLIDDVNQNQVKLKSGTLDAKTDQEQSKDTVSAMAKKALPK